MDLKFQKSEFEPIFVRHCFAKDSIHVSNVYGHCRRSRRVLKRNDEIVYCGNNSFTPNSGSALTIATDNIEYARNE